jgi:tRNA-specific 2-thiouridylase
MSGGVDSSVAAALLKQQGYDVTGMMLRLWSEPGKEDSNRCCTPDSMGQARRVAAKLDIPFYVVDAKEIFRKTVVQYFLDGYASGQTPYPCLVCNQVIRWGFLLDHALALGADYMATGHYARVREADDGRVKLLRSVDAAKDQSYVLHVLSQDQLRRARFPVGDYPKAEIRKIAESFGLPTASRADSQDLCFLAGDDYRNFIQRNLPEINKPGKIVTRDGNVIGQHNGLSNYTIGQRKGLGISSPAPLYVISKVGTENTLVVDTREELGNLDIHSKDVNWVGGAVPPTPFQAMIKIRYTAHPKPGLVTPIGSSEMLIRLEMPARDITPGQAAVIYIEDEVIGGGIITE